MWPPIKVEALTGWKWFCCCFSSLLPVIMMCWLWTQSSCGWYPAGHFLLVERCCKHLECEKSLSRVFFSWKWFSTQTLSSRVLMAHTEWLLGVWLRLPVQYVIIEDCDGLWLFGCHSSVAEHWRLKPRALYSIPSVCCLFFIFSHRIKMS